MKVRYQVTTVEFERGWGQRREYDLFDTYEAAAEFRDRINSYNKPLGEGEIAPDWYMIAEQEIRLVENG
jgi:hypothetical protein